MSGIAQEGSRKVKEGAEEIKYEQTQLDALKSELKEEKRPASSQNAYPMNPDFEGGFGGQEDLEDRYATTSGEH